MADYAQWNDATTPLAGDELAVIFQDGHEVKTAVSNFGGGGSQNAILVEGGSSEKISAFPNSPTTLQQDDGLLAGVQRLGDDDILENVNFNWRQTVGAALANLVTPANISGNGPHDLTGFEYSTIIVDVAPSGTQVLTLPEASNYPSGGSELSSAVFTIVYAGHDGFSLQIVAPSDNDIIWGDNVTQLGATIETPTGPATLVLTTDGSSNWFVVAGSGTWTGFNAEVSGLPFTLQSPTRVEQGAAAVTVTLLASGNIGAGTSVSVNSAGHAVQTWGPAPNVAGVISIAANTGLAYGGLIRLSSTQFVGWTTNTTGQAIVVPVAKSGTALTVGTPNSGIVSAIGAILPMSATTFIVVDQSTTCFFATVSGGAITVGASASASAGVTALASLSATSFVLVLTDGSAQVGTVSGTTISFGTAVTMGSGSFNGGVAQVNALSSSLFVVCFGDGANSNEFTAVAATVIGNTITAGTAVAAAGSSVAYLSASGPLSTTHFAMGYSVGPSSAAFAIVGSVSGTVVTLGAPALVSYSTVLPIVTPQPATGGVPLAFAVIDATHIAFGAGGVYPLICSISGTTLTVPNPVILANSGYPTVLTLSTAFVTSVPATSLAINSIAAVGSNIIVSDGVSNVYEIDSSNNISPSIQHPTLWNYGLTPADSTTVVAWFTDWNDNFLARVITFEPVNASSPIGTSASAATSGNPVTITLSGACSGFTGLSPGQQYYSNGDGSITTANIGHPIGVAKDSATLIVNPR